MLHLFTLVYFHRAWTNPRALRHALNTIPLRMQPLEFLKKRRLDTIEFGASLRKVFVWWGRLRLHRELHNRNQATN